MRRRASLSVCTSPVRTAACVCAGSSSRVFSSSAVLPAPGELMKFSTSVPAESKDSRSRAAMRSFSLRTFFSMVIRSIVHLLKFDIGQVESVAGALGDFQHGDGKSRTLVQHVETESEGFGIHSRVLTDSHSDFVSPVAPILTQLLVNCLQNRVGDAHFVHAIPSC